MIRYMGGLGQSSDPAGPSWHPDGLPLVEGLIEVVTKESSAAGERHAALADSVGKIAIKAWGGIPTCPAVATKGEGVLETFRELLRFTYRGLDSRHEFATKFGVSEEDFLKGVLANFVKNRPGPAPSA